MANNSVWVDAVSSHKRTLNAHHLDELYVQYKRHSLWAVVGIIGTRDVLLYECPTEKDAEEWLEALLKKLL